MNSKIKLSAVIGLFCAALAQPVSAQVVLPDWDEVNIKTIPMGDGIYVLEGFGGNIGVLTGPDGVLLVDDQYNELSEKNIAAIQAITDAPIRFVVNTHWHGDHSGANPSMKQIGANIVSTDVTRELMHKNFTDTEQFKNNAPITTFNDEITFHINGQQVQVFKVTPAHTAGDAIVYFQPANIMHMGDTSFNGFYPYIDVANGGSIDGMIQLHEEIYQLADDETRIIFGHGEVGTRADLARYKAMLETVNARVQALKAQGLTLDEIIAAEPLNDLDPEWGQNLIKAPGFLTMVYNSPAHTH